MHSINKASKFNYAAQTVSHMVRSTVINLGIRRQPRPYRRSRAGKHLFSRINVIVNNNRCHSKHQPTGPNLTNLAKFARSSMTSVKPGFSLKCGLVNCRSVVNKIPEIQFEIVDHNLDVCALTETWLVEDDTVTPGLIPPPGYAFLSSPRTSGPGGGVGVVFKKDLAVKRLKNHSFQSVECSEYAFTKNNSRVILALLYRPPSSSVLSCMENITDIFEENVNVAGEMVLLGDLNVHMNKPDQANTILVNEVLDSFNYSNLVQCATHRSQNTIDVVCTRNQCDVISAVEQGPLFSDHFLLLFDFCKLRSSRATTEVTYRKLNSIDNAAFSSDLLSKMQDMDICAMDVENSLQSYNEAMGTVLDAHAPLRVKRVSNRPKLPWFNDSLRGEIKERRKLEKRWLANRSDSEAYKKFHNQRRLVANLFGKAEKSFFTSKLQENAGDYKAIFATCNQLLNRKADLPLPESASTQDLADEFNMFFVDKITKIRTKLDEDNATGEPYDGCEKKHKLKDSSLMNSFRLVSDENIMKLVRSAPTKSCEKDPVPTALLKSNLQAALPLVSAVVNKSLQSGQFPLNQKEALIRPLLKKAGLEPTLKNYRPVSNLSFMSKLIERAVVDQLTSHIDEHSLIESFQSAYRKAHSTETALLRVKSDIMQAIDDGKVTCLLLLDLSAAFDTIDRSMLLKRLEDRFGVSGLVLEWIKSYLHQRSQKVVINGYTSASVQLDFGVPQGSVLGPILFTLYTTPLGDICRAHDIPFHLYADDTQLYLSFEANHIDSREQCITRLEDCVGEIQLWMRANMLKLNAEKTEFMLIGTWQQLAKCELVQLKIGDEEINPVPDVRNLGFYFDKEMKGRAHVAKLCSSSYFMLRNIRKIRRYLDTDSTITLVQALIVSRVDYCNSVLAGAPKYLLDRLQRIMNMSCRVVYNLKKFDHITYHMNQLHWLKIPERITYKIAVLVFKCKNGLAPGYLKDLLPMERSHGRSLRSTSVGDLPRSDKCRTSTMLNGSFAVVGPIVWNALPKNVKTASTFEQFKINLKTHLFPLSYPCKAH